MRRRAQANRAASVAGDGASDGEDGPRSPSATAADNRRGPGSLRRPASAGQLRGGCLDDGQSSDGSPGGASPQAEDGGSLGASLGASPRADGGGNGGPGSEGAGSWAFVGHSPTRGDGGAGAAAAAAVSAADHRAVDEVLSIMSPHIEQVRNSDARCNVAATMLVALHTIRGSSDLLLTGLATCIQLIAQKSCAWCRCH